MNGKNGNNGSKPQRVKEKDLDTTIEKVKKETGKNTVEAIHHICRKYEQLTKTEWEQILDKIDEMKEIAETKKQSEFCTRMEGIADSVRRGNDGVLELIYKVEIDGEYPGLEEVFEFMEKEKGGD